MARTNRDLINVRREFTEDYKMQLFTLWYNSGKPTIERFYSMVITDNIKEALSGNLPTKNQLRLWIREDFESKSTFLDHQAAKAIEKQLVSNKIEMLLKHAKMGEELYDMGMVYLRENKLGNARNALSAVIEGIRIEKESIGTPIKFAELDRLTDDQLLDELNKLVTTSQLIRIEPND